MTVKQKDRMRKWIRLFMVFVASILIIAGFGIPVGNNAIALGVEKELKRLPLPADTQLIESNSVAGKLVGNGNGMQYFGAILIKSQLSLEDIRAYYRAQSPDGNRYTAATQTGTAIAASGIDANGKGGLSFKTDADEPGYYVVYAWGSAPEWLRMWLDTDLRAH